MPVSPFGVRRGGEGKRDGVRGSRRRSKINVEPAGYSVDDSGVIGDPVYRDGEFLEILNGDRSEVDEMGARRSEECSRIKCADDCGTSP